MTEIIAAAIIVSGITIFIGLMWAIYALERRIKNVR